MQEEKTAVPPCPICASPQYVRWKLLCVPYRLGSPRTSTGHIAIHTHKRELRPGKTSNILRVDADFMRAYYCDLCGRGFVTEELLRGADVKDYCEERGRQASPIPCIADLHAGQTWVSEDFDAPLPESFWRSCLS